MGSQEVWGDMENGDFRDISMEQQQQGPGKINAQRVLASLALRRKSEQMLVARVRYPVLRDFLANLQEVLFGTKLFLLFVAIPMAFAAQSYNFGRGVSMFSIRGIMPWIFALSLIGLAPLAERVSFLTEPFWEFLRFENKPLPKRPTKQRQMAYFTGPTVGGLLNATCGNATELIIAIFALHEGKIHVLKYSLLGSILSNLLLVLGSSLFCGGLANLNKQQTFDGRQADVNSLLLLVGLLCHVLPLMFRYSAVEPAFAKESILEFSRVSSIVMLVAYVAYLIFQLKTHTQLFQSPAPDKEEVENEILEEEAVIGFWSALIWLIGMTIIISILSEDIVGTIEAASGCWGVSVSFSSMILIPIVGNAAEHAGAIIFAFKNKLDISLGIALGSATQISLFVVPLCVIDGWIMGIPMDLDFSLLETSCLALSIILVAFTLQDGTSHYMKGAILCLFYFVIGACFFVQKTPNGDHKNADILGALAA